MSFKYRFTITYKDGKAAHLVPGTISHTAVCSIFKADLRALKINQPKSETIRLDKPGSVSFTFMRYEDDSNNNVYESCQMLEMTQNQDLQTATLKKERSIRFVSLVKEPEVSAAKPPDDPRKMKLTEKDQNTQGSTTSQEPAKERKAKRVRYNDWFPAESPEPGQILSSPATAAPLTPSVSARGAKVRFAMDAESPSKAPSSARPIKVEAPDDTLALSAIPSLPSRPSLPPSFPHGRTSSSSMHSPTKASRINQLSRDLWDTRKEISIAQERESRLQKELQKLTGFAAQPEAKESHQERNRRVDMEIQLHRLQLKLDLEQEKRAAVERSLKDVERECREPFVVPALLKAFIKISQLSSTAVDGVSKDQPRR